MGLFLLKKLPEFFLTLFGATLLSFTLIRIIPGDPVQLLLGERGGNPQVYAEMREKLGLNKSLPLQYTQYLTGIFRGDFGTSIVSRRPVLGEFSSRLPATIELASLALIWACFLGIPLGFLAARKKGGLIDSFVMTVSLTGHSLPIFWWGLLLILFFSITLGLTPVSGRIDAYYDIETRTGFMLIDSLYSEDGIEAFWDALKHILLPSFTVGTIPLATLARITRGSLLEVMNEDYIRTARSKGLSMSKTLMTHAFKNALIPIVTVIGLSFGTLLTGALLTETIFSWPGIGKWIIQSVHARDYPVIQSGVLLFTFIFSFIHILLDVSYRLINPRLRSQNH